MSLEQKIDFKTVYTTDNAFSWNEGNPQKQYGLVYGDKTEFEALVDKLNLPCRFEGEPFESRQIRVFNKKYNPDFSEEMVICVFQGQRTSGGCSIEIADIVEKDDKIVVSATAIEPSDGVATANMMYPAHFVACKKSDKPVEFNFVVRDSYAEELSVSKRYQVSPKLREHPPELSPNAKTSRAQRITILTGIGEKIYAQLKKDCEQVGVQTEISFVNVMGVAFIDLENYQVKELEKRGYKVDKAT